MAPGPSTTSQIDDTELASEFEKGCGCSERCYEQFDVSEVEEYRLSIKELTKTERDMFLMGKLQILIRDPGTAVHAQGCKEATTHSCLCFRSSPSLPKGILLPSWYWRVHSPCSEETPIGGGTNTTRTWV